MERKRFYPVSSGILLAAALTAISSFTKGPPRDGPCGPEMLTYEASEIYEHDGIGGVLPPGCSVSEIRTARMTASIRREARERSRWLPSHELVWGDDWVFANSEHEAQNSDLAATQLPLEDAEHEGPGSR